MESMFAEIKNSGLQDCNFRESFENFKFLNFNVVVYYFSDFKIFEIFEHPLLSEHFQKSVWKAVFSMVVSRRM